MTKNTTARELQMAAAKSLIQISVSSARWLVSLLHIYVYNHIIVPTLDQEHTNAWQSMGCNMHNIWGNLLSIVEICL